MMWLIIISLIVIGMAFLLLEILVVPGATVVGIVGVAMMAVGVYLSYSHFDAQVGHITLAATFFFIVISIGFALKSKTWKKAMLNDELKGKVNVFEEDVVKKGDEGVTISRLNPMGKALINGEYYEVTSKDDFINENSEIEIVKVEGNKIIVKLKS